MTSGIFEGPNHEDSVFVKVAVLGKPGAGKSNLIKSLCGLGPPSNKYIETIGVFVQHAAFRLHATHNGMWYVRYGFWECGGRQPGKFAHMAPACQEGAHCHLQVFSLTDRSGFEEVRRTLQEKSLPASKVVVVGTRQDSVASWVVSPQELQALKDDFKVEICLVGNTGEAFLRDNEPPEFLTELYGKIAKTARIPNHALSVLK